MPPTRGTRAYLALLAFSGILVLGGPDGGGGAWAQTPASGTTKAGASVTRKSATASRPTTTQLQRLIEEQRRKIDEQESLLTAQQGVIAQQQGDVDSLHSALTDLQLRLLELEQRLNDLLDALPDSLQRLRLEERLKRVEAVAKPPELPPDTVSRDFPRSIRIPGSDAALRIGGRARVSFVLSFDPLGTSDRFLTNSIPVGDTAVAGEARRTNFSARTSRLNFEFRTPAGTSQVRTFLEGDFAGTANAFRLRHAYAQYGHLILGQTWSTFSDPEADHLDIDFEGVSSENVIRQTLARYSWTMRQRLRAAVALETPEVSATGGKGVNLVPDIVGRMIWQGKEGAHLQAAGVFREIRVEPDSAAGTVTTDVGWGLSLSGVTPFKVRDLTDRFVFQVNGGVGIARYINDLNSLGGSDAVVDPVTGDSGPLPALGWYVDYEHTWAHWQTARDMKLRSSVLWSAVIVDNLDYQPPDAYRITNRLAVNAIFSPNPRFDCGVEYIFGVRENKDGQRGTAGQIQVVTLFVF